MRHLGVCDKTAWLVKHKLMEVMREREDSRVLDGRVELDDAYLGGELVGGKPGRGSEKKVSFIAAVQTTRDGHPQFACFALQSFTTEGVGAFAAKSLAPSATVVSGGLWCFRGVTLIGAEHQPTVTGGGAACVKLPQFNAINTLLGGTYRAFDFAKYAHRYLAGPVPIQSPLRSRLHLASLLRAACGTSPRPAQFIRAAEICRQSGRPMAAMRCKPDAASLANRSTLHCCTWAPALGRRGTTHISHRPERESACKRTLDETLPHSIVPRRLSN
jgi:hypothetical protein